MSEEGLSRHRHHPQPQQEGGREGRADGREGCRGGRRREEERESQQAEVGGGGDIVCHRVQGEALQEERGRGHDWVDAHKGRRGFKLRRHRVHVGVWEVGIRSNMHARVRDGM